MRFLLVLAAFLMVASPALAGKLVTVQVVDPLETIESLVPGAPPQPDSPEPGMPSTTNAECIGTSSNGASVSTSCTSGNGSGGDEAE